MFNISGTYIYIGGQQGTMRDCKEMKSLSLQKEIKESWGKEPYLHILGLQERSGIAWARLGAWRALKFTDDSGMRVCPMCGNFEDEFHILGGCENLESLRNQMLPESFLNSGRGSFAFWELMVNKDNWLKVGRFLDKVRKIRTLLFD